MNKNYTYMCPNCNKELDCVGQAQEGTIFYHYTFSNREWEQDEIEIERHISFYCINCGKDLPTDLEKEIWEKINKPEKVNSQGDVK